MSLELCRSMQQSYVIVYALGIFIEVNEKHNIITIHVNSFFFGPGTKHVVAKTCVMFDYTITHIRHNTGQPLIC